MRPVVTSCPGARYVAARRRSRRLATRSERRILAGKPSIATSIPLRARIAFLQGMTSEDLCKKPGCACEARFPEALPPRHSFDLPVSPILRRPNPTRLGRLQDPTLVSPLENPYPVPVVRNPYDWNFRQFVGFCQREIQRICCTCEAFPPLLRLRIEPKPTVASLSPTNSVSLLSLIAQPSQSPEDSRRTGGACRPRRLRRPSILAVSTASPYVSLTLVLPLPD